MVVESDEIKESSAKIESYFPVNISLQLMLN